MYSTSSTKGVLLIRQDFPVTYSIVSKIFSVCLSFHYSTFFVTFWEMLVNEINFFTEM